MNKYVELLDRERAKREWSFYKLALESGVPQSTIHHWIYKGAAPTLKAIEQVCDAFGLTLGEFFTQSDFVELTGERKIFFDKWSRLTKVQKSAIMSHMDGYLAK